VFTSETEGDKQGRSRPLVRFSPSGLSHGLLLGQERAGVHSSGYGLSVGGLEDERRGGRGARKSKPIHAT